MKTETTRRHFLSRLAGAVVGGGGALTGAAGAQEPVRANVPDAPFRVGHMTFFTGSGAVLGEPMYKGQLLAAEEINARGGLLGRRKIEILKADENAGTDANVKEMRRLKRSENIDLFCGVMSSGNTPALGPVAEELKLLAIFVDGSTDFLFDKALPNPHFVFRIANLQSVGGVSCAVAVARTWPDVRRIAHVHPDYSYGRNVFDHFNVALGKLVAQAQVVSETWAKLGTTDFSSHITRTIAARPDLIVSAIWGGDYVAFYKQALQYGVFAKARVATTLAFGMAPHMIGKDHPEGVIAGVQGNYYFTHDGAPSNRSFVDKYSAKFREFPNYEAEGAYTATFALKAAVEKAYGVSGTWPDDEAIIRQLEGLTITGPAGRLYIRPDTHQGYKDAIVGFSKNTPEYPFPILDGNRIIRIPVDTITAPPGWPRGEPTSTYTWIAQTWKQGDDVARSKPEEQARASKKAEEKETPPEPRRPEFGRYHALVIGNQAYRNLKPLRTPVTDAKAVADLLDRDYGFKVHLLTDVTRVEMVRALDDVLRLTEGDNLLIYYAGHGWLDRQSDRGYWLPVDAEESSRANWLSNADITDTLRSLRAKHVLVVADSCYSGTLIRGTGVQRLGPEDALALARKRARTVLTSGGQEPVSDVGGGAHSVFAKAFLDALRENRGIADVTTLFVKMRRQVLLNATQTPEYSDIRQAGHDGGDFVFVHR